MRTPIKMTFLLFLNFYFLTGCHAQKLTHQETVTAYYNARDALNYTKLKAVVNDSITIIAGDYTMPYNSDSFYEVFKWDSIFKPSYTLVKLEENDRQIIAAVTLKSIRNTFLKNEAMTCEYKFSFNSGKISKIEELECKDVDWQVWQKERDSLVRWINKNHPKLDGFIIDMSMNGALNYLKAMERYEAEKNHPNASQ